MSAITVWKRRVGTKMKKFYSEVDVAKADSQVERGLQELVALIDS